MEKLLYIDACIRDNESRTKRIATPIIEKLKEKYEVETLCLNELNLNVVLKNNLNDRMNGNISQDVLSWANKVKEANKIVIAAPFWDMSFPSALKVFFELVSINEITFISKEDRCYGNCVCDKLLYITTRGMDIKTGDSLEQATPYLKALSCLWGIKEVLVLAKENFDYLSEDKVNIQINNAINEGLEICKTF